MLGASAEPLHAAASSSAAGQIAIANTRLMLLPLPM